MRWRRDRNFAGQKRFLQAAQPLAELPRHLAAGKTDTGKIAQRLRFAEHQLGFIVDDYLLIEIPGRIALLEALRGPSALLVADVLWQCLAVARDDGNKRAALLRDPPLRGFLPRGQSIRPERRGVVPGRAAELLQSPPQPLGNGAIRQRKGNVDRAEPHFGGQRRRVLGFGGHEARL
ncbi:MAG: hypothetical protein WDO13_11775 [Verrucomicrobiota bacterium]